MSQTNRGGTQRSARRLTPEQRRRIQEMRRRRRRRKRLMIAIPVAAALIAAVAVGLSFALGGRGGDRDASPEALPASEAASVAAIAPEDGGASAGAGEEAPDALAAPDASEDPSPASGDGGTGAALPEPSAAAQSGAAEGLSGGAFVFDEAYVAAARGAQTGPLIEPDLSKVDPAKRNRWPEIEEGYIPIVEDARNVEEKVIAITVDDCFQADNLRRIVQCALDNGGKLTIFPIGKNLANGSVTKNVKWAWENGMEIENHTYNHVGMYHYGDERMTKEIWAQAKLLNQVLGVNYQQHFFRPKGGDEREDQRVHAYVNQMGMNAIAMWGSVGSLSDMGKITGDLKPGQVYLFHTTNRDMELLLEFIPYAVQQGYRLVTLNDLYGLPVNETGALTEPGEIPALQPFEIRLAELQKTTYIRAAAVVQKRLNELGWMEDEADGVFGKSSYTATRGFQAAAGLKADGKAGEMTQTALFADGAPSATQENIAKAKAKLSK